MDLTERKGTDQLQGLIHLHEMCCLCMAGMAGTLSHRFFHIYIYIYIYILYIYIYIYIPLARDLASDCDVTISVICRISSKNATDSILESIFDLVTWWLTENRLTENRLTENRLTENRLTENRLTENRLTENRLTENCWVQQTVEMVHHGGCNP